jgi:hypothetical protein
LIRVIESIAQTGLLLASSGADIARVVTSFATQVPEPGVALIFALGAGALGLRMGRKRKP